VASCNELFENVPNVSQTAVTSRSEVHVDTGKRKLKFWKYVSLCHPENCYHSL